MKAKLGFIGNKKPDDYTKEKYIVFPECVKFSYYYEIVGSISPIILESEIYIDEMPLFKVNVFLRDKFFDAVVDEFFSESSQRALKQYKQMSYSEEAKVWH